MLDAFKNITGGKGKLVQQQTTELETLIATAREERSALSAMLTSLTTRSAKLTPLSKSLEQVTDRATAVTSFRAATAVPGSAIWRASRGLCSSPVAAGRRRGAENRER